ncbi:MAG: hypothetical protein J0M10_18960 [Chitinophagales bacterium]|nr:hypothetical protein [Chitinophagales bacterium]
MAGISSKALNEFVENKRKFQQYELNSSLDINLCESFYRLFDHQVGRFVQSDPKPNEKLSLYSSFENNPIRNIDILGDTTIVPIPISQKAMPAVYQNHLNYIKKHPKELKSFFGFPTLLFDYEPDRKQHAKNRAANKAANPINNKDPKMEEDEVAPASTKQGGCKRSSSSCTCGTEFSSWRNVRCSNKVSSFERW